MENKWNGTINEHAYGVKSPAMIGLFKWTVRHDGQMIGQLSGSASGS